MKRKKKNMRILLTVLLGLCLTACGKQANVDGKEAAEYTAADRMKTEQALNEDDVLAGTTAESKGDTTTEDTGGLTEEDAAESAEKEAAGLTGEDAAELTEKGAAGPTEESAADGQPENNDVITAYLTENIEYSDEIMPVQYVDDLSLLADMKYADSVYAYQDGKIYYRRYHEDSYEEAALWGSYAPLSDKEKEIVCIDENGTETVLFVDEGYGDIYLLDNRFYMTEIRTFEEDGAVRNRERLYSVDMQGKDRIDYGNGSIFAIDETRNIVILEMAEEEGLYYYVLNYKTGEKKPMLAYREDNYYNHVGAYQDGWFYYERVQQSDFRAFELWAVSLEGERRKIIALTTDINQRSNGYKEGILNIQVDGDRIYFIVGGYDGSAAVFQGGKLVSIKPDGTDYKAIKTSGDVYYVCHDNGKTFIYLPYYSMPVADDVQECDTAVWDVDADICYLSDYPQRILHAYDLQAERMWQDDFGSKGVLCEQSLYYDEINQKEVNIYAVPDDSGRIVRVAMNLDARISRYEEGEADRVQYEDLYFADGFLYFKVEYSVYDKDTSIGWRDGYRRLRSDVYRLKTGESTAKLLYSY